MPRALPLPELQVPESPHERASLSYRICLLKCAVLTVPMFPYPLYMIGRRDDCEALYYPAHGCHCKNRCRMQTKACRRADRKYRKGSLYSCAPPWGDSLRNPIFTVEVIFDLSL